MSNQRKTPKRRKSRLAKLFNTVLVLAVLAGITFLLCATLLFHIETIEVQGDVDAYTPEQIIDASGLKQGDNMFGFNRAAAAEAIKAELCFVEEVTFARKLPDKLIIQAQKAVPTMQYSAEGKNFTVSGGGKVLYETKDPADDLITVFCALEQPPRIGAYIAPKEGQKEALEQLRDMILEKEFDGITQMDVSDVTNVKMLYDNRIELIFGNLRQLEDKMSLAKQICLVQLSPDKQASVDLTIVNEAYVSEKF